MVVYWRRRRVVWDLVARLGGSKAASKAGPVRSVKVPIATGGDEWPGILIEKVGECKK